MGGGGAATECQLNVRRLVWTEAEEGREKECEGEGRSRSLPLAWSVRVCDGLSTCRGGLPGVGVVAGSSSAAGVSAISCSSFLPASLCSSSVPFSSSSFLLFSASSSLTTCSGAGGVAVAFVPLTVWRACRLGLCSGRENGTRPYPNWPGRMAEDLRKSKTKREKKKRGQIMAIQLNFSQQKGNVVQLKSQNQRHLYASYPSTSVSNFPLHFLQIEFEFLEIQTISFTFLQERRPQLV